MCRRNYVMLWICSLLLPLELTFDGFVTEMAPSHNLCWGGVVLCWPEMLSTMGGSVLDSEPRYPVTHVLKWVGILQVCSLDLPGLLETSL